jgi:hypothetical protein
MRQLVWMFVGLLVAGEKLAVVAGERLLLPPCGGNGNSCVIRPAAQQKRAAASTVPKPRMG